MKREIAINAKNGDNRELEHRLAQIAAGRRNPRDDYENACEAVKRTHAAFKASRDKQQRPSASASDNYAKALRDLDLATKVLSITEPDAFKRAG